MAGVRQTAWNLRAGRSVDRRVNLGRVNFDRRRRTGRASVTAALAAAGALFPDLVGVGHRFPHAALAALRPHTTAAAFAASALLAAHPRTRAHAAGIAATALVGAASLLARACPAAPKPAPERRDPPERRDLTVLAANVLVGRADTGALATLLERERPDLVCLPEAGPDYRDKLAPLVAALGYRAWASTAQGTSDGEGVVLLAAERMGELHVTSGPELRHRYLRATGGALGARAFYAVHPEAPMSPSRTAWWRADLAHIARWCAQSPAPLVAGDFNATADNALLRAALRHCPSAADGTGRGLVGTFPAGLPPWCGIQIDHVLVPAGSTTTRFAILPVTGSDHRAVLAGINLPTE